ncbi:PREDICTED: tudor domain-containing protein 5 isoform X3 [Nicrophorus vespilloides]|uniref:Tudor domain-containing protein 5 isoform X3 n=1 Tax=Nicrophorus vespilloides TaxID=110193 RepID=A0ABM1M049_NICVS|nr:PREDICTED: tudor domain-containing protein 5 isoform X3 [Nicrophorus vespilloides]
MREEECKMLIRAIVTSIPHAIDIRVMAKEFFDTIGHEIPYKQFGFKSLELYLKSIPDVVSVHGTGSFATVSVVCVEKTAHIREMVLKQKQGKRKPFRNNNNHTYINRNNGFRAKPNFRIQTNHYKPIQSKYETQVVQNDTAEVRKEEESDCKEVSDGVEDEVVVVKQNVEKNVKIFIESVKINYNVPNDVQLKLKMLIDSYPNGMWCSNLPIFYRDKFKDNLQYAKYGYISIIHMCSSLPAIFKYQQVNQGDYRLYNINANIVEASETELLKQIEDFNTIYEEDVLSPHVSDLLEIIELGSEIEELKLKLPYSEDDYMDIILTEIFDPSKFWFSLMENEEQINNLVYGLNEFCKTHLDKYLVREEDYKVGLYCAVKFQNIFHRAKIISVTSVNDSVQVFYIDYGTFLWLPKEQICYLHKSFAKMPAQALRGCLANIQPLNRNTRWDSKATQNFIQLAVNRRLVANIQRVQDGYYELIIADTNGPKDIYINDSLVLNGHGLFNHQCVCEKEQIEIALHEDNVPNVSDIHLYPTFEDLESGQMPNFMELCTILNVGVPYNSIFPKYFEARCAKLDLVQQFKDFLIKK